MAEIVPGLLPLSDPGCDIGRFEGDQRRTGTAGSRAPDREHRHAIQALALRADYVARQYQTGDFSTTAPAGGPGGNLIATILQPDRYIDALRARTVIRQAA